MSEELFSPILRWVLAALTLTHQIPLPKLAEGENGIISDIDPEF
jgi:hypothetical protein